MRTKSLLYSPLLALSLALAPLAACGGSGAASDAGLGGMDINTGYLVDAGAGARFFTFNSPQYPTITGGPMTLHGGATMPRYRMVVIYFNGPVPGHTYAEEDSFFKWLASSSYLEETMGEYGYLGGSTYWGYVDLKIPPSAGSAIGDNYVQTTIAQLISQGKVPQPDGTTIYFAMMAAGVECTNPGGTTCPAMGVYSNYDLGWHSSFSVPNSTGGMTRTLYAVIGAPCTPTQNFDPDLPGDWYWMQDIVTHELAETITDSQVAASGEGTGWFGSGGGTTEIGDLCNGEDHSFRAPDGSIYIGQLLYSNHQNSLGNPPCVF